MSDYQRIVSYLYEYHHGIKGANVGFAKIEKRQKQLRLYFHVKTNDKALKYKIYFYRFRHGAMEGILLDSIQRSDTVIEFKNSYPLIAEPDTIDGFLIYNSNDYFFGSQWKDHPISIRNFLPLDENQPKPETPSDDNFTEQETKESNPAEPFLEELKDSKISPEEPGDIQIPAEEPEDIEISPDIPENTESIPEKSDPADMISEEIPADPSLEIQPIEPEDCVEEPDSETEMPPEKETSTAASPRLAEYIEALQLEKCAKEKPCETPSADFDWKEYPTLLMPADYCFSPCIKIQLEDLEQIPNLPEHMKTNGFLLLNYGNYGHLMFAREKNTQKYYLGVPGIFDNEKSFISKLFGFQSFLTVPVKAQKTGNFGYFILPV